MFVLASNLCWIEFSATYNNLLQDSSLVSEFEQWIALYSRWLILFHTKTEFCNCKNTHGARFADEIWNFQARSLKLSSFSGKWKRIAELSAHATQQFKEKCFSGERRVQFCFIRDVCVCFTMQFPVFNYAERGSRGRKGSEARERRLPPRNPANLLSTRWIRTCEPQDLPLLRGTRSGALRKLGPGSNNLRDAGRRSPSMTASRSLKTWELCGERPVNHSWSRYDRPQNTSHVLMARGIRVSV